jgi:hypothetical protein
MVILDDKGKLFGKINIIDLLVVIALVAGLVFGGYKIIGRYFIHTEYENYKVVLRAEDVHPEMVDAIRIGDKLIERSGAVIGTVIEPRPYLLNAEVYVQNREGRIETSIQPKLKDIIITVLVKTPVGQRIKYNTNNLLIGSRLEYEFATEGSFRILRYESVNPTDKAPTAFDPASTPKCLNLSVMDSIPGLKKYYGVDGNGKVWSIMPSADVVDKLMESITTGSDKPVTKPTDPAKPELIEIPDQFKTGDVIEVCGTIEDGEGVGGSHMRALCVSISKVAK